MMDLRAPGWLYKLDGCALGELPKRPKGSDCKSAGVAFGGSNPSLATAGNREGPRFGGLLLFSEALDQERQLLRRPGHDDGGVLGDLLDRPVPPARGQQALHVVLCESRTDVAGGVSRDDLVRRDILRDD